MILKEINRTEQIEYNYVLSQINQLFFITYV